MNLISYAQTLHDLNILKENQCSEIILGHKDYSRFSNLDTEQFFKIAERAKELSLKVIFEWDILMTENVFTQLTPNLAPLIEQVDSIRVQDPGALEWILTHSKKPVQFIAENGHHNLKSLQGWIDYSKGRMERIILSIELTKDSIAEYVQKLTIPCEILGMGRILLFYTPRNLLSPLRGEKIIENSFLTAVGESEESPHKGFPILENKHGTFMFHIKEFSLLEFVEDLKKMGLSFFRIDLRWEGLTHFKLIRLLTEHYSDDLFLEFKTHYPNDLMRGFYLVNKTDVLFPKLKNSRLQNRQGDYLGEVVEVEKGAHLAILVKNSRGLKSSDFLKFVHPQGKEFLAKVFSLRDVNGLEVEKINSGNLALIQFVGGVWVKSQVFLVTQD